MSYFNQRKFTFNESDNVTEQVEAAIDYNEVSILQIEQGIEQLRQENSNLRQQNLLLQNLCHKLSALVDLPNE